VKVLKFIAVSLACQQLFASSSIVPRAIFRPVENKNSSSVISPKKAVAHINPTPIIIGFTAAILGVGIFCIKHYVDRAMSYGVYVHKSVEVINNFYVPSLVFKSIFSFFENRLSEVKFAIKKSQNILDKCQQEDDQFKNNVEYISKLVIDPVVCRINKFDLELFVKEVVKWIPKKVIEVKDNLEKDQEIVDLFNAIGSGLKALAAILGRVPVKIENTARKEVSKLTKAINAAVSSLDNTKAADSAKPSSLGDESTKFLSLKGGLTPDYSNFSECLEEIVSYHAGECEMN